MFLNKKIKNSHQFCTFPSSDLNMRQRHMSQNHATPSGHKQYLFAVNFPPQERYRPETNFHFSLQLPLTSQMTFGQNYDKFSGLNQSSCKVRTPHVFKEKNEPVTIAQTDGQGVTIPLLQTLFVEEI